VKKLLLVLSMAGLVLVAWRWIAPHGGPYANFPPTATGPWVAFGDSLTAGTGAEEGKDYPSQLSKRLGVKILNHGSPGETTMDALARLDQIIALKPRVALVCLGGNDVLRGLPADPMFANIGSVIDRLHEQGAFVVLIGVRSASLFDQLDGRFTALAREKRVLLVPNILKDVLGSPRRMADYVHPNAAGYAHIATRVESALHPLLGDLHPR
jgi:lysophospholipase L1-like esterase